MSDDDLVRRAAQALRDEGSEAPPPGDPTRERLLRSLERERPGRSRRLLWLVPLAATLAFSTAWAAATGRLARVLGGPAPDETTQVAPASSARAGGGVTGQREERREEPGEEPRPDVPSPAASEASQASPPPAAPGSASPAPSSSAAREAAEERLYRAAHHVHFVERDPQRALAAWDAYLREAKVGRFRTEAAYNRALTLVRLGRKGEARASLTPFAEGRYGGYRRDEARALLEALGP